MNRCSRMFVASILVFLCATALSQEYVSLRLGMLSSSNLVTDIIGINHPTRCDSVLYDDPSRIPTDAACANTTQSRLYSGDLSMESGISLGIAVGNRIDAWRIEGELQYSIVGESEGVLPLARTANEANLTKATEWVIGALPSERASNHTSIQLFANVTRDVGEFAGWTPYVGVGAGYARLDFRYEHFFYRKSIEQGYLEIEFDPDWPEEAKRNAAGSLSYFDQWVSDHLAGVQFIAGLERELQNDRLLGVRLTYSVFPEFEEAQLWEMIRSHAPVTADGGTPFLTTHEFDGRSYLGLGITLSKVR